MTIVACMRRLTRAEDAVRDALDDCALEAESMVAAGLSRAAVAREAKVNEKTVRNWLRRAQSARVRQKERQG